MYSCVTLFTLGMDTSVLSYSVQLAGYQTLSGSYRHDFGEPDIL